MKIFKIVLISCVWLTAFGQQKENIEEYNDNEYYLFIADQMPFFGTCDLDSLSQGEQKECSDRELIKFFVENFEYPKNIGCTFSGRLFIQWTIDAEGCVVDFKDLRPLHKSFTKAAMEVVNKMPRWIPGKRNGKPIEVRYTFPLKIDI